MCSADTNNQNKNKNNVKHFSDVCILNKKIKFMNKISISLFAILLHISQTKQAVPTRKLHTHTHTLASCLCVESTQSKLFFAQKTEKCLSPLTGLTSIDISIKNCLRLNFKKEIYFIIIFKININKQYTVTSIF